jgi:phosphatidylinositol alpha-mannosyltransferase
VSIRIGIICPYSLTMPGGVQMQVLGLARALRRKGYPTRVLGPCDGPPPDAGVTPLGNSLPTAANGSVAPVAPDPAAQLRTIRALRDENFDIVHLHEPIAPGVTTTALLTRAAPMIGTFHAAGGSLAYDLMPRAVRSLAGRLDDRVAVSEDARRMAADALGGEYDLVFNGVELRRYSAGQQTSTTDRTILFLGRHEPRKGLAVLLEAMSDLPASLRLWVVGEGPETARLQARTAGDPRIEWLGTITETEKIARLRGADVFCAPSLHGESFGIVLLEAMAASTPIVASDLPGYSNVARPGKDALLVPPGDGAALAGALRRVLEDADIAARLVQSGGRRADEFSMARLADLYVARYNRLLDRDEASPRRSSGTMRGR